MKKPKRVTVEVISRDEEPELYEMLEELITAHHQHLEDATIALAWKDGIKPDQDGRIVLGQAKKASDLDFQLHGHDFVIVLNREMWDEAGEDFKHKWKRALLDHELCHCAVKRDDEGFPEVDESGRNVWRIRKHDLEEFEGVVRRHGLWKRDVVSFVRAAAETNRQPLFKDFKDSLPDGTTVTIEAGGRSVTLGDDIADA